MTPDFLLSRLLYRDGLILIIDKPAGIPVHAGPKGGENLEDYFDALRFGLPAPPALAHRLDRDTSGCLVLGRHRKALKKLGVLFSSGAVKKTYWAIVKGRPEKNAGRIELAIAKQNNKQGWKMHVDENGMKAITDYKIMGEAEGMAWLELHPQTGRTHQLRVHLAAIGCPILGDPVYGAEKSPNIGLQLHARAIELPLYPKREPIKAVAEPPEHMQGNLKKIKRLTPRT